MTNDGGHGAPERKVSGITPHQPLPRIQIQHSSLVGIPPWGAAGPWIEEAVDGWQGLMMRMISGIRLSLH
jgi:hypothetical protein